MKIAANFDHLGWPEHSDAAKILGSSEGWSLAVRCLRAQRFQRGEKLYQKAIAAARVSSIGMKYLIRSTSL